MLRFPVIIGPTAGGKSSLALGLARELAAQGRQAELISADAFGIYRGMDIGTAKPSAAERGSLPHHLYDCCEPEQPFTVHDWLALATAAIDQIRARQALPIVVGGTHLYIKALLDGLFEGPPPDPKLRARLETLTGPTLRERLAEIDPEATERIHPNDRRRTIRAIEVYEQTGAPITALQTQWDQSRPKHDTLLVVLDWPSEEINPRINARVREMVAAGLVGEVRELWQSKKFGPTSSQALGYKQLIACFESGESKRGLENAIEQIKIETRRFAKKQRTWIKRLAATPTHPSALLRLEPSAIDRWPKLVLDRLDDGCQGGSTHDSSSGH